MSDFEKNMDELEKVIKIRGILDLQKGLLELYIKQETVAYADVNRVATKLIKEL